MAWALLLRLADKDVGSMKANKYAATFLFLNTLSFAMTNAPAAAAQGKVETSRRGDHASEHMSAKELTNTNAQWSADPEHGWVRADERHNQNQGKAKAKQTHGKQKGNSGKGVKQPAG